MSDSLQPYGLKPTRLLCPWDSPSKNTGVGCYDSYRKSSWPRDRTCVSCSSCIGRQILYHWATGEALAHALGICLKKMNKYIKEERRAWALLFLACFNQRNSTCICFIHLEGPAVHVTVSPQKHIILPVTLATKLSECLSIIATLLDRVSLLSLSWD